MCVFFSDGVRSVGCERALDGFRWVEMGWRLYGTDQNYWKNQVKDNLALPAVHWGNITSFWRDIWGQSCTCGQICVHFNPLQQIGCYLNLAERSIVASATKRHEIIYTNSKSLKYKIQKKNWKNTKSTTSPVAQISKKDNLFL